MNRKRYSVEQVFATVGRHDLVSRHRTLPAGSRSPSRPLATGRSRNGTCTTLIGTGRHGLLVLIFVVAVAAVYALFEVVGLDLTV